MNNQKSINTVLEMQNAFKENGIETRKLPRSAALRVSFMGSFFRVTHAGENKGWLVGGYNEEGDPVKLSELRSLCEELSPVAIGNSESSNPEPAQGEELATDEAAEVAISSECMDENSSIDANHMAQILSNYLEHQGAKVGVNNPNRIQICFTNTGDNYLVELKRGWELLDGSIVLAMASADNSAGFSLRRAMIKEAIAEAYRRQDAIAPPSDQITGKALTLQQPWAWAITHLGKNIENRVWPTDYRGELYIHAGKGWDANGAAWIEQNFEVKVPPQNEMRGGELVAKCNLAKCQHWTKTVEQGGHPKTDYRKLWWRSSGYHWFLEDIEVLETPIPLRGKLGIFTFSVIDPKVMDPHDVDSNAWCVANAPIADDEIDDFGVPGTKIGGLTLLPTREDESVVRRRHLIKRIYALASRTGVQIDGDSGITLRDPEECPMADLEKILNQLLALPPVSDGIDWWRSHQDDDHGEPINYRPSAEMAS
ncbi:hypothetical protein [Oscillatoria acuminata]|uniref:ASCH domain-containing protein n=1 Tax=Oscillatoria acuminata PCC 6304 TaxID=56110 RepID=K9TBA3_9CYAN|nr:hypothetical protein [Oscillatoria acuminata]AFY80182.1 hypothetical protein Oscil6304_0433 [Oscillatoria acuminata PCC 6304]